MRQNSTPVTNYWKYFIFYTLKVIAKKIEETDQREDITY